MSKVSVITLSHNYGRFLLENLNSVKAQTFRDFEHIVVNAGSTDGTKEILEADGFAYAFPSVRVFHIENMGVASNRNWAIRQATGEYVVNLDADDWALPTFLERLTAQMAAATVVCPGLREFGNRFNFGWPAWGTSFRDFLEHNRIFYCSMFTRADFDRVGGYDEMMNSIGGEDYDLWTRLVKSGCAVKVVHELLLMYRVHGGSFTDKVGTFDDAVWHIRRKHSV